MPFGEVYAQRGDRPVISFELFPPKSDEAMQGLRQTLPQLIDLRPDFITVTYGAGGSTRTRTLEVAGVVQNEFRIPTACHLTCVGSSRTELDGILSQIQATGIRNIVALRGDPPKGEANFVPATDGYANAHQLVAHIRRWERGAGRHRFGLAVAGYPEKHVEAPDMASDLAHLKAKVEQGADIVITQLFYDNRYFFEFVKAARASGVTIPIVPGLLPILSAKQVMRIAALCGSRLPADLAEELQAAGDDAAKGEEIGVRQCIRQATELIEAGVPGIHFYVLNKSAHMRRIMDKVPR